jgi:hypothetical protein
MLAGFKSRWTTPCSWAWWMARAIVSTICADSFAEHGVPLSMLSSVPPSTNIRVVETGCGFGFSTEASALLRPGEVAGQDHLQGHQAVESELTCLVYNPHSAAADLAHQLVIAEPSIPNGLACGAE